MIDKNNFLVKFYDKGFNEYVKPYIESSGSYWGWNGDDTCYYGFINGESTCNTRENPELRISVEEFRRIILNEDMTPQYEIY